MTEKINLLTAEQHIALELTKALIDHSQIRNTQANHEQIAEKTATAFKIIHDRMKGLSDSDN